MERLLTGLRAAGEETRLRVLNLLSHGEFNVSELTQILNQSQPRVSRHLKLMVEAGLLDRFKEGSWVMFRLREEGRAGDIARAIVALMPQSDPIIRRDLARVNDILHKRRELAERYFDANAANWDELRSLHISEAQVERAMVAFVGEERMGSFVDLGTGTGRILELLAPLARQAVGVDSSRQMLAIARARIAEAGLDHAQVRHGDLFELGLEDGSVDLVSVHQVLHYLDNPGAAISEAARVLKPGGRLLIVDFAPHELEFLRDEHAHRRLGLSHEDVERWCRRAGLKLARHTDLAPPDQRGLTVSIWLYVLEADG